MNNKFGFLLCTTLILYGAGTLCAQEAPLPPQDARPPHVQQMHENLAQLLNLTADQKTKAEQIRRNGHEKMKKLRAQMQDLRQANMNEFEAILTPEQKAEFDKIKTEHNERMKNFDHRHKEPHMKKGHHPRPDKPDINDAPRPSTDDSVAPELKTEKPMLLKKIAPAPKAD